MLETTDRIFFKTISIQISNCRKPIAVDTSQVKDEEISQQDSLQSVKEVPHIDQAYFFMIPLK
jgi:predicted ribosome-associated RNA-binding protein Tma20